tara:strand:+ start:1747 stop:2277 length:531 start_codon:yes stop_codon:yes gene_type:complete
MKIKSTKFKDLKIIFSPIYKDQRGSFREVFKNKFFHNKNFIFTCTSSSKKDVLRGMHLQTRNAQGKYLTVLKGEILDVSIDLRKKSKTFGKYFAINMSDKNGISIYIPPGFAHGFIGLKNENIISYHCTNYRSKNHEIGIIWNDKDIGVKWPIKNPILSKKDKKNITLEYYIKKYA